MCKTLKKFTISFKTIQYYSPCFIFIAVSITPYFGVLLRADPELCALITSHSSSSVFCKRSLSLYVYIRAIFPGTPDPCTYVPAHTHVHTYAISLRASRAHKEPDFEVGKWISIQWRNGLKNTTHFPDRGECIVSHTLTHTHTGIVPASPPFVLVFNSARPIVLRTNTSF